MNIVAVNVGSSSVKLTAVGPGDVTMNQVELQPAEASADRVVSFVRDAGDVAAVAHRIVHGGPSLRQAVLVDASVQSELDSLVALAPLHLPPALDLLRGVGGQLATPQVACFDTAFHARLPEAVSTYALPQRWRALGVRRYGFHGLSCAWALRRAATLLQRPAAALQLVVAHLGSGASVTAIRDGTSVDTSMGFTPVEGLVMATRSGSVDPGALTWLLTTGGALPADMALALETESGLLALGGSGDMRELEASAAAGDTTAARAIAVYVRRASAGIAGVAASLERLDALVFTGGVGEGSSSLRRAVCAGLTVLGVTDDLALPQDSVDQVISTADHTPAVLVVHAREDLEMAREARRLLGGPQ